MTDKQNTTRRDFMKTSSAAAAGAAVLSPLAISNVAHAQGSDELKIALIGAGGRGTGAAAQALRAKGSNNKLVAVADAFENNAKGSRDRLKNNKDLAAKIDVPDDKVFHGFDAYKKAIDSGVDMVVLATPPGFRPIHFEYAVQQGKHVFMEKPVAVDAPGVRQVLEAAKVAKQKNLKVGVGLQRHHSTKYQETVKAIQDGKLGDVTLLRCYWNGGGVWVRPRAKLAEILQREPTEMEYQMYNWYYFNWLCGDHITEQHIHNLDVCNWIMDGFPVEAQGQGGRQVRTGIDHGEIYDHHLVEFFYEDGTPMYSHCRHIRGCWNSVSEHVHGTKGTCDVGRGSIELKDGEKIRSRANNDPYQAEHDNLNDAIRNNKAYNEAEYGAKSSMTSILGRMATYSGKKIKWDDAINSKISLAPETYAWDAQPPVMPDADGRYPIAMPGSYQAV